jgi:hypothetical protein
MKNKTKEIELIILPPKEPREVSDGEVVQELAKLVWCLAGGMDD